MHVLPDVAYLEEKCRDQPFVVIGVHSAKFTNEGQRQTVRAAVGRYEIAHPVVIDENMRLWSEYAVRSWPTLVLVGSDRRVIGVVAGGGDRGALGPAVGLAPPEGRANGTLSPAPPRPPPGPPRRAAPGPGFPPPGV